MDIAKIKPGKRVAFRTPHGRHGKGTVKEVRTKDGSGTWVLLADSADKRLLLLRPAMLTAV